ncbi:porin [Roseateles chitosanitabidus]|uniref:porin n=1 Tax=Roseateles chitosanitabidus TaxID=65048 RepID=UPI00082A7404|nr:porin [Roseateles chitosanitabidus]
MSHLFVRRAAALASASIAATLSASALAQSSAITLSGMLDTGVYRDAAKVWQVGPIQRSQLRLDGVEDLGGGLSATFALSHRFDSGDGRLESSTKPFWYGESTVGLKGPFGSVQVGRRLDALYSLDWEFDPWANYDRVASPAWDLWHTLYPSDPRGNNGSAEYGRLNDGVFFDSAPVAGFSLHLSGAIDRDPADKGRGRGAAVRYADGRFSGVLARQINRRGDTVSFAGARGTFGEVALMGAVDVSRSEGSTARALTLGATYALGRTTFKAGWGRLRVDGRAAETLLGLGAQHALSKRTAVYADLAFKRIAGRDVTLPGVGIAHAF